jgi:hypothetical protein
MKRLLLVAVLAALVTVPAGAQGRGPKREFAVAPERAMSVTREVLVHQGYEVVRVEVRGNDRIVWYRRGDNGRGRGRGPLVKMVLRRTANRIVFVDTPNTILLDINVRLKV